MEIAGAEALRWRFAQQEHWQTAAAVRLGAQPSLDPDGYVLESFDTDFRYYRSQRRVEIVGGRRALVTCRLRKRLAEGAWHEDVIIERIQRAA